MSSCAGLRDGSEVQRQTPFLPLWCRTFCCLKGMSSWQVKIFQLQDRAPWLDHRRARVVRWTFGLILILTICYAVARGAYLVKGNHAMAVVYSGCAWPNVGLLWLDHMRR